MVGFVVMVLSPPRRFVSHGPLNGNEAGNAAGFESSVSVQSLSGDGLYFIVG